MPPQDPYNQPRIPTPGSGQPQHPSQPVTNNPYEFIMSSGGGPAKPKLSLGRGPKIPLVIGGVVVALILVILLVSMLGGSSATPRLLSIAQQQTELARVASANFSKLSSSSAKDFTINTDLSMQSTQTDYLKFLSANGAGVDSKKLVPTPNTQTDQALAAADSNGTLDSALKTELVNELTRYQQTIQAAYDESTSDVGRAEYQRLFDEAALLIEQSTH